MDAKALAGLLATVSTGAFAGVMTAIGLILGGYWRSLPPQEFIDWFAANGASIGRIIPLVAVPSVVGIVAALWLGWNSPARMFWLLALAGLIVVFIITFAWHLPANAAFASRSVPLDDVGAKLSTWLSLHYVRIAAGLASAIFAAIAISR